jgi:antitoxin component of MazEF toxin-antitoxin module
MAMTQAIVGKWGKSLAIRVPLDVARAVGLTDGEAVEIESVNGDIQIRRSASKQAARDNARAAMAEIIEAAKGYTLGGISIRELIDEGRR